MRHTLGVLGLLAVLLTMPAAPPAAAASASFAKLPLYFEPNHGQTDAAVRFRARGPGYNLFLTPTEAVLSLAPGSSRPKSEDASTPPPAAVRLRFLGANPAPTVVGQDALPGKVNYLRGNEPARWQTDIPTFAKVQYRALYPGVDLVFYGTQGQVEHDFVVAPGADPRQIRLALQGAKSVRRDARGDLILGLSGGDLRLRAPVAYQERDGIREPRSARYVLQRGPRGTHRLGFRLGAYDRSRPLVIDPLLVYSTYLGRSGDDSGNAIAVDAAGSAYVAGSTTSTDFPTAAPPGETPLHATHGGGYYDAFVAKLTPNGSALAYATYLGGSSTDEGYGIAVDAAGSAYVTGSTTSTDFPTAAPPGETPIQATYSGSTDAFVAKLTPTGTALAYATYLGGSDYDNGNAIAVDAAGSAYVTGRTDLADFPTAARPGEAPVQATYAGSAGAFVAKLTPTGTALAYATCLSDYGNGNAIAVDAAGSAYVTGSGFVAKLTPTGTALAYATHLGGIGYAIAVDAAGSAYVTGGTSLSDFPTAAPPGETPVQATYAGSTDAFVAKLTPTGTALAYATYLGGSAYDNGYAIAVDAAGSAYVTGSTHSADFPTAAPPGEAPIQAISGGASDAFVAKLTPTGTALTYATYLGGCGHDRGLAIAVDAAGTAYVTGETGSWDFPTTAPPGETPVQESFWGWHADAFVAKFDMTAPTINEPPHAPTARGQRQADSTTPIGLGGWAASRTVVFRGTPNDPDPGQKLRLQVEVRPLGTAFTGTVHCQSGWVINGTVTSCSVFGLTAGTSYHWQIRTVDSVRIASPWVSYATNAEDAADFRVNTVPARPTARGQRQADGTTPIGLGGWVTSPTVVFQGTVSDPDPGQQVRLQVEVQPLGTAFTGTAHCQSALVTSGTPTSCSVSGLAPGASYHWQTRTVDNRGGASPWASYTMNGEDAADFAVNTVPTRPTGRGQREANGTTPISLGRWTSSTTVVFLGTPSDPDPGQRVRLQIEVQPVGTLFTGTARCQSGLVSSGTATTCSVPGLIPGTSYHWQTRTVDSLGAASPWASYATNAEDAADFVVNPLAAGAVTEAP
jgi:hypothetical protein